MYAYFFLNNSQTKFRDVLDEVYELNRFPLRQHRMRCALEDDTVCSDLEKEVNCLFFAEVCVIPMVLGFIMLIFSIPFPFQFLACTTCLKEVSTVLCTYQTLFIFFNAVHW